MRPLALPLVLFAALLWLLAPTRVPARSGEGRAAAVEGEQQRTRIESRAAAPASQTVLTEQVDLSKLETVLLNDEADIGTRKSRFAREVRSLPYMRPPIKGRLVNAFKILPSVHGRLDPDITRSEIEVTVLVLHTDGRPAAGVRVYGGGQRDARTDEKGAATVQCSATEPCEVAVTELGFVHVSEPIAGRDRITLREPEGWRASILVVDAAGERVPGVQVEVTPSGGEYVLIEDGIQWTPIFTNERGEVSLPRLPPGSARVWVHAPGVSEIFTIPEGSRPLVIVLETK